jgi:hypothetical protein
LDIIESADYIKKFDTEFECPLHDAPPHLFEFGFFKAVSLSDKRYDVGELLELFQSVEVLILGVMAIKEEEEQVDPPIFDQGQLFGDPIRIALVLGPHAEVITPVDLHPGGDFIENQLLPLLNIALVSVTWRIDDRESELRV